MEASRAVAVAVAMERIPLANRWADHTWRLAAVVPAGTELPAPLVVFPDLELQLYPDEAENYLLNLSAPEAAIFVVWRLEDDVPSVVSVTASYGEAARMLDASENVDRVPLPDDLRGWIEDFARHHYRPPEKKAKTKRYASSRIDGRML